jgi:hypothetical protein
MFSRGSIPTSLVSGKRSKRRGWAQQSRKGMFWEFR